MASTETTIPILPSKSIDDTVAFYRQLGFEGGAHPHDTKYAMLRRGSIELHFFAHKELVPAESYAGCYVRVTDVESIFQQFSEAALPKAGIPRMEKLENKPWGLREFAVVDLNGSLIRIGQIIKY